MKRAAVAVGVAVALAGCGTAEQTAQPGDAEQDEASSAWGPLAVQAPQEGTMDARGRGTLRIGEQCVFLQAPAGNSLVVWPADRTTWDGDNAAVVFDAADAGTVRLADGDRVASTGGFDQGGTPSEEWVPVDWVSPLAPACETDVRWILGGIEKYRDRDKPENPAEDPAVQPLMDDYGISESQAISQMEIQVGAGKASGELPPDLAAVYSGREIHHDQGARVVVAMTDRGLADAMREHFASYGVTDVEIRVVAHTKDHLTAIAEQLQQRLRNARDPEDDRHVAVSLASLGKVTVEFVDGPMNDTERDVLAEARADPDTFEVREVDHIDTAVDVDGDSRDETD